MPTRRLVLAAAALTPLLVVPVAGPAGTGGCPRPPGPLAASVAVDWQRTAVRTIYVEGGSAPPLGALYLSFTSLAVHDAATAGQRHGTHAAAAAVAQAAHDVLVEYFPASGDRARRRPGRQPGDRARRARSRTPVSPSVPPPRTR